MDGRAAEQVEVQKVEFLAESVELLSADNARLKSINAELVHAMKALLFNRETWETASELAAVAIARAQR